MQIMVMRHGKPELPNWHKKVSARQMPEWLRTYNAAGVIKPVESNFSNQAQFFAPKYIVSSDLLRAIRSVEFLGLKAPHVTDVLYREAELPVVIIPLLKLKPELWSVLFRLIWACGFSCGVESLELFRGRVTLAAENIFELAKIHDSLLFMGHGIFNRILERKLLARGWQKAKFSNNNSYWKYQHWEISIYTHS